MQIRSLETLRLLSLVLAAYAATPLMAFTSRMRDSNGSVSLRGAALALTWFVTFLFKLLFFSLGQRRLLSAEDKLLPQSPLGLLPEPGPATLDGAQCLVRRACGLSASPTPTPTPRLQGREELTRAPASES